ncbi:MAG: S8 family peptidase [Steroidobacterales bacterium]
MKGVLGTRFMPFARGPLALAIFSAGLLAAVCLHSAMAAPLSAAARARLAAGQSVQVIVEFDGAAVDRAAAAERTRRHLTRDDAAIRTLRAQGYARIKSTVEAAVGGADARRVRDYQYLPMATWRLTSLAALSRLEAHPSVRVVHEDIVLHPDSVSDLGFINQPQTAAEGATGAGTTIAVIDGGLTTYAGGVVSDSYKNYSDFGNCSGSPPNTCRVVYNQDYYPGASTVGAHGMNVSAIALGVAAGANLAMFDVFNGGSATSTDIIDAINSILADQATYNIVVVSMSLGDGSNNASQCSNSVFAAAINSLSNAGIATVAAAGNSGSKTGLGNPACVPGVVSVGAVYNGAYGTIQWSASADSGGKCTDMSAADMVTCFSQSASYLTVLAPGTFVSAPSTSYQISGTSQATPHISGSVAVLRARYPAEPVSQTVQRLTDTGTQDTDHANSLTRARVNLLAATNEATAVTLAGSGPTQAVAGTNGTYTLTVSNAGPLIATTVQMTDTLPAGASFVSASPACSFASGQVTCAATSLASGANLTFTIVVQWTASGAVYDSAVVKSDQNDSASAGQQQVAFGTPPTSGGTGGDGPLPLWAYALLGGLVLLIAQRRLQGGAALRG